jgi:AcrR family transcriptional regulator
MRVYQSERRREQAAETRRRILGSGRRLFGSDGYGNATIEAIADDAGVSPQTVYAGFGSKRGILIALLDQMAADADLPRLQEALTKFTGNPRRQLAEQIAFNIRFYAGGRDLIEIARTVSGTEPDLAAMWQEGERRRYEAQGKLMAVWRRAGALADGLTQRKATDLLWALSGPDVFRLFVVERGWTRQQLQAWLIAELERMLFRPAHQP